VARGWALRVCTMMFNVEALKVFKRVICKKSYSRLFVKRRIWLVNQVATDVSLLTVRICRLVYRSDAIHIH
jgi:hypothetical protein